MTCDCLNFCGDDPWLNDGRAQPCPIMVARQKREVIENQQADRRKILCKSYGVSNIGDLVEALANHIGETNELAGEAFAYFHRDPSRNPEYQQVMPGAAGHPGVIAAFIKPPPPPAGKRAALISDLHQLADEIQFSYRTESIDEAIEVLSADAQPKPVFVREGDLDLDQLNKDLMDSRAQIARLRARIAVLDPVFSDAEGYQL
jgi:hypothetical protein